MQVPRYASVNTRARDLKYSLYILGVTICFPGLLLPRQTISPRYADISIVLVLIAAWRYYNVFSKSKRPYYVGGIGLACVLISMLAYKMQFHQSLKIGDYVFYARWIVSVASAAFLASILSRSQDMAKGFFIGIVSGSFFHLLTIWFAQLGGLQILLDIGWASPRVLLKAVRFSQNLGGERLTTLAETPNGGMLLIALSVPATLGYVLMRRSVSGKTNYVDYLMIAASIAILLNGFFFTLTRSSTFAALITISVFYLNSLKKNPRIASYIVPLGLVLFLLFSLLMVWSAGVDIGFGRIENRLESNGVSTNLQGRIDTWFATLDLIRNNPFGLAWTKSQEVYLTDSLVSSHNGYLFTARTIGIAVLVFIVVGHIRALLTTITSRSIDASAPLCVYIVMSMFAEDLTQGTPLTFMVALVACIGHSGLPWVGTQSRTNRQSKSKAGTEPSRRRRTNGRPVRVAKEPVPE